VLDSSLGSVPIDLPDGPVRLGLRPEAVMVGPVTRGRPVGRAVHVASLPDGVRVRLSTAGLELDAVSDIRVEVGADVGFTLDPNRIAIITEASIGCR
jgi:thiamine transport system ATP-binding protein